jgi:orotidine-5'-phosphate decarboxylase
MTVAEAVTAGADYLVVGRPITATADAVQAAQRVVSEIEQALNARS